jgi:hypothetical protein
MDAGHFDAQTAYAAVNTLRLDDMRPHLFRTHDGGKTWKEINNGIPDGAATSTIREDPKRKGSALCGHRDAGLRLLRRRRPLAVSAAEHARQLGARSHR